MDRAQVLNDPETAMRYALDGRQAQMWTAMPAIVTAVNLTKMTLECEPTIEGVQTNPDDSFTYINMPKLVDVPICFPSAGGFILTMPVTIGDEILVVFASRCIDAWWQLGVVAPPMELRMHDLSDGFAIPGPKSLPKAALVPGISSTNAQLRNLLGTTYIEITAAGKINLVSPTGIGITGPLDVTGPINITGAVTVVGEVIANAIPLSTHVHPVTTAPGTTGVPAP